MPASQRLITSGTPLGATLAEGGTTFRCWAPHARAVYVAFPPLPSDLTWTLPEPQLLVRDEHGCWGGFFPNIEEGALYLFYVQGDGSEGFKRDPYARELSSEHSGHRFCVVRSHDSYPWSCPAFRPPPFHQIVVYQFHFGVYFAEDAQGRDIRPHRVSTFLDAVGRIAYWADLGINAVMPLPFQEFQTPSSLGYNGTDLFSPETDYAVREEELAPYATRVNRLRALRGQPPIEERYLRGQANQLKTFVDLCHLYGIAVLADVVFNHAGGSFDDECLYFFDRQVPGDNARSLYFKPDGHAGGLVFDYSKAEVRKFLLDNATSLLAEWHIDGFRYDQVTVMEEHGGWTFCQDLASTVRWLNPAALQIAEYWGAEPWRGVAPPPAGMGFDSGYSDVLRKAIRKVIGQAAHGADSALALEELLRALEYTLQSPGRWSTFQCTENHDLVHVSHDDKQPRMARLADPENSRSWYGRSRSRVAAALLLTAPGIPMLFMGQELLEDKYWSDWPGRPDLFVWWEGLKGGDRAVRDFHGFVRDLLALRRSTPGLTADGLNVFHVNEEQRVIAFQRWVPGEGHDVVVVVSLNERTFRYGSYRLGFPHTGRWREALNSDVYDRFVNPEVEGNHGGVMAYPEPLHGLPASAQLTIPANSVLVFTRD